MRLLFPSVLLAAALLACEHGAPFRPRDYGPDGPLNPAPLARLTLNPGQDVIPAWLPDGSGILYTAERLDRPDLDRCLAWLPAGGGAISRYACRTSAPNDSLDVFEDAAIASDGRVAFVRAASQRPLPIGPDVQALVVAPLDDPNDPGATLRIPYTAPCCRTHDGISHVGWLGPSRLVYVGEQVRYPRGCSNCPADTVRTGLEIVALDFGGATPVLTRVPGTDSATSVAPGATGDTIYFSIAGDAQVHRYVFSSQQADIAHDFGSGRLVRDVSVAGGRLAAVVDGRVADGGDLHVVNLTTGADTVIGPPATGELLWFERPAISPDGRSVVAQARVLTLTLIHDPVTGALLRVDTAAAPLRDLWLAQLP